MTNTFIADPAHILYRDYETRSVLDLQEVGAHIYAKDPSTEVLCMAYAVDDEPVSIWVPGDATPPAFLEAARDDSWAVSAFNDQFECSIESFLLSPRFGWPTVPLPRHRCTMAAARACGLPGNLERAAAAFGLAKDMAGHRLMMEMCKPLAKLPKDDADVILRNDFYWLDSPSRRERLAEYCRVDTEIERAVHHRTGFLSPGEQALWFVDQKINDFGIYIDADFARAAIATAKGIFDIHPEEISKLTGGIVKTPNQMAKILNWLDTQGCPLDNMKKGTVADALARGGLSPEAQRLLEIRRDGSLKGSLKYEKILKQISEDGRVHGSLIFYGAHTGRWISLGVQVHNFKKPPKVGMTKAVEAVASGAVSSLYHRPIRIVYDTARAVVCAAPGNEYHSADYSGIESRVTGWVAGEVEKIAQWAKFDETGNPEDEPYLRIGLACNLPRDIARPRGKIIDLAFGYAGGVGAYRNMDAKGTDTDATIKGYQAAWREMHPKVVKLWAKLERMAIEAVKSPGLFFEVNRYLKWKCEGDFLRLRLPSGRDLVYPFPRIERIEGKDVLVYKTVIKKTFVDCGRGKGKAFRPGTYGGKLFENVVQAIARDLLAEALVRLSNAGYDTPLHVHDEIVAEVAIGSTSLAEFRDLMIEVPIWAKGLPVAAKGDISPRFFHTERDPQFFDWSEDVWPSEDGLGDTEVVDTEVVDTEVAETEIVVSEIVDTEAYCCDTGVGTEAPPTQTEDAHIFSSTTDEVSSEDYEGSMDRFCGPKYHKDRNISLTQLAILLSGEIAPDGLNVHAPGPGHTASDRSMSVCLSEAYPGDFTVKSWGRSTWQECRDYLDNLLEITKDMEFPPDAAIALSQGEARAKSIMRASNKWNYASNVLGLSVAQYFSSRGLSVPVEISNRLMKYNAKGRWYHPGGRLLDQKINQPFDESEILLFLAQDNFTDLGLSVQELRMPHLGSGPNRKIQGACTNASIKLTPHTEVMAAGELAISEGFENALAAAMLGYWPVWACMSAGNVAAFPVLERVQKLTIIGEHCDANRAAREECAVRWSLAGKRVSFAIPKTGKDFNDELISRR